MSTEIHALAGAYALDAVDDVERVAFRRHLAECETCSLEVAELRETVGRLADSTWAAPPPRLRDSVLAEVRRTRQTSSGRAERDRVSGAASAARWRRWTAGAVAAGIIAVGAATGTYVVQQQQVRDAEARAVAAEQVQSVLTAPDRVDRKPPGTTGVTLVTSSLRDAAVMLMTDLPEPDAVHAYQLWLIEPGSPAKSVGLLPAGRGAGLQYVPGIQGYDRFGVTVEPASGSDQPTTEPVLIQL